MSNKFKDKYRNTSIRARWVDYSDPQMYFITICTHSRVPFFGQIENNQVQLNHIGQLAKKEWLVTPELRPDMNITLDEFVVLPDHIHGIINIGINGFNIIGSPMKRGNQKSFGPQSKNLASIIRGYKSAVTTKTRKMGIVDFGWQVGYHEHIIRNREDYLRISNYIKTNVEKHEFRNFKIWLNE